MQLLLNLKNSMKDNLLVILKFFTVLTFILSIVLLLQTFLYENADVMYEYKFFLAYIVNFLLAIFIFIVLILLKKKHTHLLGFVYLGGSLVKFTFFFIFFYPSYKWDGHMDRMEALTFLIPYFTCLFFETFHVVRLLNK
jgi:hypothetical protein